MKKKFALFVTLALIAALLFGCGINSTPDSITPDGTESSEGTKPAGQGSTEMVKLRLTSWLPESDRAAYIKVINDGLAEYNAAIDYNFVDNEQYDNVVNIQYAAEEGPDLLQVGGQFLGQVKMGYLADLSAQTWSSDYLQSYLDAFTVDGKLYCVPDEAMYAGIAYNKDIFDQYNIDIPKTLEEFLSIGDRLKDAGFTGRPLITGAQSLGTPMWSMFGSLNAAFYSDPANRIADEDFANLKVDYQDVWKAPLEEYWIPFIDTYYTADMVGLTQDQAENEFALGNVAMAVGGAMGMGGRSDNLHEVNPDINYGIFPYPALDGKIGWAVGGPGTGLGVNPNGKNLDLALKAIEIAASADAQLAQVETVAGEHYGPLGRKDLQELPLAPECDQSFLEAMAAGNLYYSWGNWPNAGQILDVGTKALQMYMTGEATLDDYLRMIDEQNVASHID